MLPKGSKYTDRGSIKVSDSARPTNLTEVKASGAIFKGANLKGTNLTDTNASGAIFNGADLTGAITTGATLKDATLKWVTFAPLQPPERPASGALHDAWQPTALVSAVARAGAAADNEDNNVSSDGEDGKEEGSPKGVEAKVEEALGAYMSKLGTEAKAFMRTVDKLLGKVEERKGSILNRALEDKLCNKLTEAGVNQGAIEDILLTFVISPLLERYLPEALDEALSEYSWSQLPQPTDELLKELLKAFKELALNAGKAALLERLSPIVNTCVRASGARAARGPAVDEEQPLVQPKTSADCLVQELWPAIRA